MPAIPRYKIRFRDPAALRAAQAIEAPMSEVRVVNHKRQFLGAPAAGRTIIGRCRESFRAAARARDLVHPTPIRSPT
jgi:hypothetical protein